MAEHLRKADETVRRVLQAGEKKLRPRAERGKAQIKTRITRVIKGKKKR